jgi:hypothetical protein
MFYLLEGDYVGIEGNRAVGHSPPLALFGR